jgi:hypothetical protein
MKFFFDLTLDRPEAMKNMRHVFEPCKVPEILSLREVIRLLYAADSLNYQAALGTACGARLISGQELKNPTCALKPGPRANLDGQEDACRRTNVWHSDNSLIQVNASAERLG